MKHNMKRALALFIALLLAMPSVAWAEEPDVTSAAVEAAVADEAFMLGGGSDGDAPGGDLYGDAPAEGASGGQTETTPEGLTFIYEDAPEDAPADGAMPVSVVLEVVPETAVVVVCAAESGEAIPAEADGAYLLLPGEYSYTAVAEGYGVLEGACPSPWRRPTSL